MCPHFHRALNGLLAIVPVAPRAPVSWPSSIKQQLMPVPTEM
jgi:hypothetical protein